VPPAPPAPVRLVAITDRRLMVAPDVLARGDWPEIARGFAAAIARILAPGVLVQVREKDLDGGPLLLLVRAALATGALVAVNDRLDIALAAGAHGVHLPEHGLPIPTARALLASSAPGSAPPASTLLPGADASAAGFLIGASCHSIEGAHAAARAGADLVQLGPIWDTPGKGPPLGPAALAAARAGLGGPARLVAVGGIDDADRARLALGAGADAVAAIRAVWSHRLDPRRVLDAT
jgi:thiamine-phosphate pyrophosphorylase